MSENRTYQMTITYKCDCLFIFTNIFFKFLKKPLDEGTKADLWDITYKIVY